MDRAKNFNDGNLLALQIEPVLVDTGAGSAPSPNAQEDFDSSPASASGAAPLKEVVQRLSQLSPLEYDTVRKEEARALGVRPGALDEAIKHARKRTGTDSFPFPEVEPWSGDVDPAELLTEIFDTILRFIVCSKETAYAATLWIAMTWFIDVVDVAPLAVITAPEKRCGKSQLLSIMEKLSCKPVMASNISPAALYRTIHAWAPTLFIDEADSFIKDNEEIRGVLNSGHTRDSAYVIRTVGDAFTPTRFSTWGAKALAGIGHLPDTLMDRAIVMELRRKLPGESVDRIRYAEPGIFAVLRSKLARLKEEYGNEVKQARPPLPKQLNDRAQDNWEPLLSIAMMAGEQWLDHAIKAALKISGGESTVQTTGTELLADIRGVFDATGRDRISSADLLKALCADDEKAWSTFNRGTEMSPRQLARELKGYGISSRTIRYNHGTIKGYEKAQFDDAFSRYIPVSLTPCVTA